MGTIWRASVLRYWPPEYFKGHISNEKCGSQINLEVELEPLEELPARSCHVPAAQSGCVHIYNTVYRCDKAAANATRGHTVLPLGLALPLAWRGSSLRIAVHSDSRTHNVTPFSAPLGVPKRQIKRAQRAFRAFRALKLKGGRSA